MNRINETRRMHYEPTWAHYTKTLAYCAIRTPLHMLEYLICQQAVERIVSIRQGENVSFRIVQGGNNRLS